jgi:NAD(P)-dependent dehydrogenase (short-subunit alcohol dehydrogenase family)
MSGRVAVVTGGSSGIGLACGRMLAEAGYDVVLTARREAPLKEAADAIGASYVAADSSDVESFATVIAQTPRVDLLIHAAGVLEGTFVRKESIDTFDLVLRANLRSAFVVSHTVLPVMPQGGRIIFLSSSSSHAPQPGRAAYSASKAGLNAFAGAMAKEVERDGISVHIVTTGPVATPMLDDVHFPMIALHPEDVARTVVWLDTLSPSVALLEVTVESVQNGPFAPEAFVPEAAKKLGRTQIP